MTAPEWTSTAAVLIALIGAVASWLRAGTAVRTATAARFSAGRAQDAAAEAGKDADAAKASASDASDVARTATAKVTDLEADISALSAAHSHLVVKVGDLTSRADTAAAQITGHLESPHPAVAAVPSKGSRRTG